MKFVADFLVQRMKDLLDSLADDYPRIFLILGNDDLRADKESSGPQGS